MNQRFASESNQLHKLGYFLWLGVFLLSLTHCGKKGAESDGQGSEIALGSIGGSANDNISGGNGAYASNPIAPKPTFFERAANFFTLIPDAFALQISCTPGSISPSAYAPNTTFAWTPLACTLTFRNGKSTSVTWSGSYTLAYDASCTGSGFALSTQPANCSVTRTTPSTGTTRSLRGANNNTYAVTHNTVSPSGYDPAVTTATSGALVTCTAAGCASRTLSIGGSHITASYTPSGGAATTLWDHTVTTEASAPLIISGLGASKVVSSGTLVVQHNLAKFTSRTKVTSPLNYTLANCCFPTSGEVTTTFTGGKNDSQSETLTFSSECGEATLTQLNGTKTELTLQHCL